MPELELLSFSTLKETFSLDGAYSVGYAFLYGMSIWVSFFGGVIAYKSLPRQQFGALQHRTFPVYFFNSIVISGGLLALWTRSHPHVLNHLANPLVADVAQAYILAFVSLAQAGNYFVIGPMTSKCMFKRHQQEKKEGKAYSDAGVSDEMKALNKQFGALHGVSSLFNLFATIALTFHGLWIGSKGIKA
ncbi:hypothetical protein CYLTODRAFT_437037 [Cylindrobasidium torrendii FP15055 ss-10]|uniref:TMEM205-like domain-containing protein n=1 Tax=Cylindrobasidium torrendii FP15055 ss-10 TaxID=1314674 RepID=A0A0D7BB20_9AGAR|nr:hypothetical protein CYLTODRAFT_437037 [Cylindrobasidium torrendii FP15055 ss-10]